MHMPISLILKRHIFLLKKSQFYEEKKNVTFCKKKESHFCKKKSQFFAKIVTILRREKNVTFEKKITILFNKTLLKSLIMPTHRNTNEKIKYYFRSSVNRNITYNMRRIGIQILLSFVYFKNLKF
jgi:hypothetical protein